MYFDSLHALINMDGHGVYVWSAYPVTILVIIALLIIPMRRRKRILKQVEADLKRSGKMRVEPRQGDSVYSTNSGDER